MGPVRRHGRTAARLFRSDVGDGGQSGCRSLVATPRAAGPDSMAPRFKDLARVASSARPGPQHNATPLPRRVPRRRAPFVDRPTVALRREPPARRPGGPLRASAARERGRWTARMKPRRRRCFCRVSTIRKSTGAPTACRRRSGSLNSGSVRPPCPRITSCTASSMFCIMVLVLY